MARAPWPEKLRARLRARDRRVFSASPFGAASRLSHLEDPYMRGTLLKLAALALCATPLSAQSVDSLIAQYVQASGGMSRMQALQSLRRSGKFTGSGGFEAVVVQENKRPNSVREE